MNHIESLVGEAKKLEQRARNLRKAAALISGRKSERKNVTTKKKKHRMEELVALLKEKKTLRIFEIHRDLGVAKPTIYLWLKKKDVFDNKSGVISLKS